MAIANTALPQAIGTETSSRNSEVIHGGLYYGAGTLKTRLCIRGRDMLYGFCAAHGVPHRNTGKWVVGQTDAHREALEAMHAFCASPGVGVPVRWVGADEMRAREPAVRAAPGCCLESPTTGIVDSHALMVALLGLFEESGGTLALGSSVEGVAPLGPGADGAAGWEITVRDARTGGRSTITAETLVNAAGLGAVDIHNLIVPAERRRRMYYAKGNYFAYSASSPRVSTLIYPAPEPGHGGLGTHLTLDMGGRIKFGPDVEWVDSADGLEVNGARMPQAIEQIKRYLPGVDAAQLTPDYAGIRPKLAAQGAVMQGKGFNDFYIRKEDGYKGWINLLGIESPGLTSCLSIGDMVKKLLYT